MSYTIPPRAKRPIQTVHNPPHPSRHTTGEGKSPTATTDQAGRSSTGSSSMGSGYHVVIPDTRKNSKLKQTKDEEEAHRLHKQLKRPASFQTASKLGGDSVSVNEVRERQDKQARIDTRMAPIRRQLDREKRREEREEKEMAKIREHKQRQREKSEILERKREMEEPIRLEEMRKKRLAYFDSK